MSEWSILCLNGVENIYRLINNNDYNNDFYYQNYTREI